MELSPGIGIRAEPQRRPRWGYDLHGDPAVWIPNADAQKVLGQALLHLDRGASLRRVRQWIEVQCGRRIGQATLIGYHHRHQQGGANGMASDVRASDTVQ